MQPQAQRRIQTPVKTVTASKGCAGCMLCAAGRLQAPEPKKLSGGRSIWPRSLLSRCVGG